MSNNNTMLNNAMVNLDTDINQLHVCCVRGNVIECLSRTRWTILLVVLTVFVLPGCMYYSRKCLEVQTKCITEMICFIVLVSPFIYCFRIELYWCVRGKNPNVIRKWVDKARNSKYETDLEEDIKRAENLDENMTKLNGKQVNGDTHL